jgi:hypothetical protein
MTSRLEQRIVKLELVKSPPLRIEDLLRALDEGKEIDWNAPIERGIADFLKSIEE